MAVMDVAVLLGCIRCLSSVLLPFPQSMALGSTRNSLHACRYVGIGRVTEALE